MSIRLVTWNLQGANGVDVAEVVDTLTRAAADVVFLQEVGRRQASQITASLDAASLTWTFKHWSPFRWAEGLATVGVTAPLRTSAHAITYAARLWSWRRRIVQRSGIEVDGRSITAVHAHLSPHADGAPLRLREADRLVRTDPAAAMVVGDLNETPGGPTLRRLRAAGLHDAWADSPTEGTGSTNWSADRDRPADQRIDYVLYGLALHPDAASVPDTSGPARSRWAGLSDHLPLTVTLSLAP